MKNIHHQLRDRLRAGVTHFALSAPIAAIAGLLVFGLWYPYPYREISGGRELFVILMVVDLTIGPLVTVLIFNRAKPRRELVTDITIVALLQFAALSYGLWSVFVARPVHLVFEYSRFSVVHAVDIERAVLAVAPPTLRQLPLTGPTLIALRPFKSSEEQFDVTMAALRGAPLAARSDLWQPYTESKQAVLQASRPVSELVTRFPEESNRIEAAAARAGSTTNALRFLPMVGRKQAWTALIDPNSAEPLAYVPIDSF
jgi:hypothetical protein